MSSREPKIGRLVRVTRPFHDDVITGKVVEHLSKQFTFLVKSGEQELIHFAFYTDEWEYKTGEKK